MKEIVIVSGKGGTGKTSLTAALAFLASRYAKSVFADCDVDAADLHLVLVPEIKARFQFRSGREAVIRKEQCSGCGKCRSLCRYGAVEAMPGLRYRVNPAYCEGCGVCVHFCPEKGIDFPEKNCGIFYVSSSRFGELVHAEMGSLSENSGKLVSMVKQKAREIAEKEKADFLIVDGPPGIGCPVIASVTGADAVLAVTEPTLSGEHDLKRVAELTRHFNIPLFACVNKWDINPEIAGAIEKSCMDSDISFLGRIPYDSSLTQAQIECKSLFELPDSQASRQIEKIWEDLCKRMN